MDSTSLSRLLNLTHEELLREFPEVALLKEYALCIRDYYIGTLSSADFAALLRQHDITESKISEIQQLITQIRSDRPRPK